MYSTPQQRANLDQPRLSYYITRTNGTFVPLIPADELPFNVRLQGVPRLLNSDQIFGLQQVAMLPYTGQVFKLENETTSHQRSSSQPPGNSQPHSYSNSDSSAFHAPDAHARQKSRNCTTHGQVTSPTRSIPMHELTTNWRKAPTSDPQAVIDAIVGTKSGAEAAAHVGYVAKSSGVSPPSGKTPDQEKKEYCTYWLRHGECDYIQQGCLYKHEIPDKATLLNIGFRSTPRWWLERNQTIKLGGERATVGPIVKSSVWLKGAKTDDPDTDASESEGSEAGCSETESIPKKHVVNPKRMSSVPGLESTASLSTRPYTSPETVERKQSTASDLIDFRPLLPTPPSSVSSHGPRSSSDETGDANTHATISPSTEPQRKSMPKKHLSKVFLPAGEAPVIHIAEAEKRSSRHRKSHVTPSVIQKHCHLRSKSNTFRRAKTTKV